MVAPWEDRFLLRRRALAERTGEGVAGGVSEGTESTTRFCGRGVPSSEDRRADRGEGTFSDLDCATVAGADSVARGSCLTAVSGLNDAARDGAGVCPHASEYTRMISEVEPCATARSRMVRKSKSWVRMSVRATHRPKHLSQHPVCGRA